MCKSRTYLRGFFLHVADETLVPENIGIGDERASGSKLLGVIPEPGTALLLVLGLAGLAGTRKRALVA